MANSDFSRVTAIILRATRAPLMTLLVVYSIAVLGMTQIPGIEVNGEVQYMSIFHAFYFMTYTATTTGFGEIPTAFSDAQRIWAILCLYSSVIAWFYAIGAIVQLLQNPHLQQSINEERFERAVGRIEGDFYILCGFGDTGSILARGLSDAGVPCVILDSDPERIKALLLRNYRVSTPGLCADASIPKHLLEAGLKLPRCRAIVAVTNNEEINLKISAVARVLNNSVRIVSMSKLDIYEETLSTLGRQVHVVDPFKSFASSLSDAIHNPMLYVLYQWLVGSPEAPVLQRFVCPPRGVWVVCGYGRMGHEICATLHSLGVPTAIIDPNPQDQPQNDPLSRYIVGSTTAKTLIEADIRSAVGVVAGTDDDGHNLGILLNARSINPRLFTIVRQNRHENEMAFSAADADIIMQPSLVTARRILFVLIAPLLKLFFRYLKEEHSKDPRFMASLLGRLEEAVGQHKPDLFTLHINRVACPAVVDWLEQGRPLTLSDLLRDPRNREKCLQTVVLMVQSGRETKPLPDDDYQVGLKDQLLFCGLATSHRLLRSILENDYTLHYVCTGEDLTRSYVMQWLSRRQGKPVTMVH